MSEKPANGRLKEINQRIAALVASLEQLESAEKVSNSADLVKFVRESKRLLGKLETVREALSPVELGRIGITLGRSDSIAKFFAFSFLNDPKRPLSELESRRFYGSGVYVGKTDPDNPYAETSEAQGMALCKRLREHSKNIGKTQLSLADFQYRAAPIQSGMQAAVEGFLIAFFKPIWNKEIGICFGLGKHGDKAGTRQNKRSPWDTMHPGRKWALATKEDQFPRKEIEEGIREHFSRHPPIRGREELLSKLALTA